MKYNTWPNDCTTYQRAHIYAVYFLLQFTFLMEVCLNPISYFFMIYADIASSSTIG